MTAAQCSIITPHELHQLLAAGGAAADLLDVRTPGEHSAGHVPGTKLIPLDDLDAGAFLRQRGANDKPIYLLCQSGSRARKAAEKFKRAGFARCVVVEGGTQAWMDAGLAVNRGPSRALPLIRQVHLTVGGITATGAALALWVNPSFALIPLVTGCGMLIAGSSGFCAMAVLLAKMPWNRLTAAKSNCCSNN